MKSKSRSRLKAGVAVAAIVAHLAASAGPAAAFCGFYVARADAKMFNKSSKVVLARDAQNTVITMASDYEGKPNEFALVVPVPTLIRRDQVRVVDNKTIDHLDAYTAPRLVEYYDPDPCAPAEDRFTMALAAAVPRPVAAPPLAMINRGVTIEARYDVAEYDILILSAEQSDGLIQWLNENGYKIPAGAEPTIGSYIRQNMHFFVAKVNMQRLNAMGRAYLQPLQVRYQTAKFMLPLRLGTVNASGPQDLTIYALTRRGRVEAANYRTVKMPSGVNVPLYVKDEFPKFYQAVFDRAVARENRRGVFVEYAWDLGWCDPCASAPMSNTELSDLGVTWLGDPQAAPRRPFASGPDAFVTRLHVRYDAQSFPEDLVFLETADRTNFQARYVINHPYTGGETCPAAKLYREWLPTRNQTSARNAADLTGWPRKDIEARMQATGEPVSAH